MGFRHCVMFKWKPEATEPQKALVLTGLLGLPGAIPVIR
jgi:hypothetical protein